MPSPPSLQRKKVTEAISFLQKRYFQEIAALGSLTRNDQLGRVFIVSTAQPMYADTLQFGINLITAAAARRLNSPLGS